MIQKFRAALGWISVALLVSFLILNIHTTHVNFWYLLQVKDTPIAVVVIAFSALGAFAMYMFQAYRRSKDDKNKK